MGLRVGLVVLVAAAFGCVCSSAFGAVTPGWECVPTTAGQAVVSGGTGATPSCSSGTPVLAPTYVSSGVGGKPTVEFSSVNVQVVSGSGSTNGAVNGEGNLIVGYAENANSHKQTGSNDLVLGSNNGWSGYGELVVGSNNQASNSYATAVGVSNTASGLGSFVAGHQNVASGTETAVTGGQGNKVTGAESSITGGQDNLSSDPFASITGGCDNLAGSATQPAGTCATSGDEAILGGFTNAAAAFGSSVSGGENNKGTGPTSSILGGNGVSVSATDGTAPTGVVGSVTGSVGFSLGANACGAFSVGDSALQLGDVPLFAYTTTPPSQNVVFTPGAVTTAGQAKFTACNLSSSSTTFSGSIHLVAFRG
jgi:trimeric autotransporter adhesin